MKGGCTTPRRSIRTTSIRSLSGLERREITSRSINLFPKNKTSTDFSVQNTLNQSKNQKAIDVIERFQKHLIENQTDDLAKQIDQWVGKYKTPKDRNTSISFTPHTLQPMDQSTDESRIPRIIEAVKQLILKVEALNVPQEELECKALDLIADHFLAIYDRIENAFDEEATVDLSEQNGYVNLKGRRAFRLLSEFSSVFSENEAIYKIFPLSKSESFAVLSKLNVYIKKYILREEENIQQQSILLDLNIEKINTYLTLIERLASSLDTITKGFKNYAQALEVVLKNILSSEMIPPFYDSRIDFTSAPEEATSSISMSKNNSLQFQDKNGGMKKKVQPALTAEQSEAQRAMEMIEESDEDYCDDEEEEIVAEQADDSKGNKHKRNHEHRDALGSEIAEKFTFHIEYLKPGNIPWDIHTIRSEGKIGSGGQGTVFKAFDPTKERQIALKFTNLPPNWESQKDSYLQEIRIQSFMTWSSMKNVLEVDNKVYIYQDKYGKQQMYLVSLMELGVGSLDDFLKICAGEKIVLSDSELFTIFFDILEGLDGMHRQDYAHKDIKPQNVIFSIKDKKWKLADFGCIQQIKKPAASAAAPSSSSPHTSYAPPPDSFFQECYVTGTPSYMSPELYALYQQRHESGPINLISNDFYGLGVTLLKLREMEKIERSKLSEKILINRLSSDRLSKLISVLLHEDQVYRSQLTKESLTEMFQAEYLEYISPDAPVNNYLETIFKYDENAQDNLNINQKLECAKTYWNINLREKCLRYFEEIVNDPEFEKLETFEKRSILVEQAQALSFFGDYENAYEQQMKCLQISTQLNSGASNFRNKDFMVNDLRNLGQILFNQGKYELALNKYMQAVSLFKEDQNRVVSQSKRKTMPNMSSSQAKNSSFSDSGASINSRKRQTQVATPAEKSVFHRNLQEQQKNTSKQNFEEAENPEKAVNSISRKSKTESSKVEDEEVQDIIGNDEIEEDIEQKEKQGQENTTGDAKNAEMEGNGNVGSELQLGSDVNCGSDVQCGSIGEFNTESMNIRKDFAFVSNENSLRLKEFELESKEISSCQRSSSATKMLDDGHSSISRQMHQNMSSSSNSQGSKKQPSIPMLKEGGDVVSDSSIQNTPPQSSILQNSEDKTNYSFTSFDAPSCLSVANVIDHDKSLEIKGLTPEAQNDLAQIQTLIGQALNKLGHYDKALQYYEGALKTTEKNLGKNDCSLAVILDSMGESLVNNGKYKDSFRIFKRSYKIKRSEYGKNSVHLAETINSMGKVLLKLTLYDKSAQHYQKALSIYEQHYGHNHIKTGEVLNNLGCVKRAEGNYKEAYRLFQEVLTIFTDQYPEGHIEIGKIYHDIGNVLRNQENHEASLEYFLKAKEIKSKHYGSNHVEVSTTCQYIGIIYRKMEKIELAQEYLEMALDPMVNHYGKDHIEVVKLVQEIAVLMQSQGKDLLAKEKLEFVLENRIKEFGTFHIKTANTMQNVATVEMELGNYAKSLEYNLQVLEVRKQTFGAEHLKVANSHTSVAQLHELIGSYSEAMKSFNEAIQIYNQDLDTNKSKIQQAFLIKAKIQVGMYRLQEALDLIEGELLVNFKPGSLNFAQAQLLLSQVLQLQKMLLKNNCGEEVDLKWVSTISQEDIDQKISNSSVKLEEARILYEQKFGKEHYLYAQILEQTALVAKDASMAKTALAIKMNRFGENHIEIIHTTEILCVIEILKQERNPEDENIAMSVLIENLQAILALKSAYYKENPLHIQLLPTNILLFKLTKDQKYRDEIMKIVQLEREKS